MSVSTLSSYIPFPDTKEIVTLTAESNILETLQEQFTGNTSPTVSSSLGDLIDRIAQFACVLQILLNYLGERGSIYISRSETADKYFGTCLQIHLPKEDIKPLIQHIQEHQECTEFVRNYLRWWTSHMYKELITEPYRTLFLPLKPEVRGHLLCHVRGIEYKNIVPCSLNEFSSFFNRG